jgi:hypothetical protein
MRKRLALFVTPILLGTPSHALATDGRDTAPTEFVRQYLSQLQEAKIPVVYAECRLSAGGKVGVVFPMGKTEGLFFEMVRQGTVVNTARVVWTEGQWTTDDAHGGVYTVTRLNNLVGELLRSPFSLISPDRLNTTTAAHPKRACASRE